MNNKKALDYPFILKTAFAILLSLTTHFISAQVNQKANLTYPIVGTNQSIFFDNSSIIATPSIGSPFYGQDAQFKFKTASYTDNGDGTITDNITGLIWQKSYEVMTYEQAKTKLKKFKLGNKKDWRIPTIKEAYSLIQFDGIDVSSDEMNALPKEAKPFIDSTYFDFKYGSNGDRVIDVQMLTSTIYTGTTMGNAAIVFGVNLADGRIKGYPISGGMGQNANNKQSARPDNQEMGSNQMNGQGNERGGNGGGGRSGGGGGGGRPGMGERSGNNGGQGARQEGQSAEKRSTKLYTVRFVRGNEKYGENEFIDNNNGTISDNATGLMWEKADSKMGMNWENALAYATLKNKKKYLGYSDWRLPNAKELQSIVDYSRSPQKTNSAAIDPIFDVTCIRIENDKTDYPYYWSSTTHEGQRGGEAAIYVCFGEGLGFMNNPQTNQKTLMDVHGAGSQRSDPKTGNANDFPTGRGPQGDVIRIQNMVRLVRGN